MLEWFLGTAVCYALGTAWLAYEAEMTFQAALMAGVVPFIIGDIAKMIVAIIVAPMIKNPLVKPDISNKKVYIIRGTIQLAFNI